MNTTMKPLNQNKMKRKEVDENQDVWIVTPKRMQNKETRKLNSQLGLHKINKFWIRVSRNK